MGRGRAKLHAARRYGAICRVGDKRYRRTSFFFKRGWCKLIDFHCHLDLYKDPRGVLKQAVQRKCYVLAVTTTPLAWHGTRSIVGNTARVKVAVGLHPELAATRYHEVDRLCLLLPQTLYVGEIGLDGSSPHRSSLPVQRHVFDTVLSACESVGGRIMSIHSRGATSFVLSHLEAHGMSGVPVMHWFSGTPAELERAIHLGCWFSVGPAMLRTEKGRGLVSIMPKDRVLTESDGPFARRGRKPLTPLDVIEAEMELGALWKLPPTGVQRRLYNNLRHLISTRELGPVSPSLTAPDTSKPLA